ncbi:hypothetical protein GOP47_0023688 [Adiantum capillus-veneris]|uniref:Uncharacterized protein n=1 Tax=Adiantum capillus-veneris TaxID=13818 RepID=A0A9D4U457_ADICA|nr:hypothetical protein GOP47_0023688 [Adiantum capillus-veneris]
MGNGRRSNPYTLHNELNVLSAEVSAHIYNGTDACITLSVPKKRGIWPAIMQTLHSYNIEVVNATLTSNNKTDFHCIHCKLEEESGLDRDDLESLFDDICIRELSIKPCRVQ